MAKKEDKVIIVDDISVLCRNSIELIHHAREMVARQVNIIQIMTAVKPMPA